MPEFLFNKVAGLRPTTLLKKRLWHRLATLLNKRLWFSCEFCEISKNTILHRIPLVAASEIVIYFYFYLVYKRNHYSVARRDGTTINGLFDDGRKYPENILNGDLNTKYENSVIDKQIHPDIQKESPTDNKQKEKKDKKGKSKIKRKKDKDKVKTLPINNPKNKDRNSTFRDILPKRSYASKSVNIRNRSKSLDLLDIYKDKDIKSPHEVSLKLETPGEVIYPTNVTKERVARSHSLDFLDHIPGTFLDNYPERDYPNEDEHDNEKKKQYEYDEADFVFGDDSVLSSPKDSSSMNRPPSVRGDYYDHVAGTVFSDNSNLLAVQHQISRPEHESAYATVMKGGKKNKSIDIKPSLIVSDVDNKSPVYDVEISKSPTVGVFSYQLTNDNEEIIEGQSPQSPAHKYLFEHQVTIDESIYSTVNDLRITTSSREPEKYHTFKLMKHYKSLGIKFSFAIARSSHLRCFVKKVFLEISQNSQENTCVRVSFLIKLCVFI